MSNKKYVLINPQRQYFKEISKQNKIIFTNDINNSAKIDYSEIEDLSSLIESYSKCIVVSEEYNDIIPINQDCINKIAKDFNDKEEI